jgi:hypothetical protein
VTVLGLAPATAGAGVVAAGRGEQAFDLVGVAAVVERREGVGTLSYKRG